MTKCYEALCEPFFSTRCLDGKSESWQYELMARRRKLIEKGVRFDGTKEDMDKYFRYTGVKPAVARNLGTSEWFTPLIYIKAARAVMGSIDVDPATTSEYNEKIQAPVFFTKEEDGLTKEWKGNVWLNPPYAQPAVKQFCDLLVTKYIDGEVTQAIVLINNVTETDFFQDMLIVCSAVCFPKGRVKFLDAEGRPGAPLQGQAILYFGIHSQVFKSVFKQFGEVLFND